MHIFYYKDYILLILGIIIISNKIPMPFIFWILSSKYFFYNVILFYKWYDFLKKIFILDDNVILNLYIIIGILYYSIIIYYLTFKICFYCQNFLNLYLHTNIYIYIYLWIHKKNCISWETRRNWDFCVDLYIPLSLWSLIILIGINLYLAIKRKQLIIISGWRNGDVTFVPTIKLVKVNYFQ